MQEARVHLEEAVSRGSHPEALTNLGSIAIAQVCIFFIFFSRPLSKPGLQNESLAHVVDEENNLTFFFFLVLFEYQ